jgi:hypothetical protein
LPEEYFASLPGFGVSDRCDTAGTERALGRNMDALTDVTHRLLMGACKKKKRATTEGGGVPHLREIVLAWIAAAGAGPGEMSPAMLHGGGGRGAHEQEGLREAREGGAAMPLNLCAVVLRLVKPIVEKVVAEDGGGGGGKAGGGKGTSGVGVTPMLDKIDPDGSFLNEFLHIRIPPISGEDTLCPQPVDMDTAQSAHTADMDTNATNATNAGGESKGEYHDDDDEEEEDDEEDDEEELRRAMELSMKPFALPFFLPERLQVGNVGREPNFVTECFFLAQVRRERMRREKKRSNVCTIYVYSVQCA